MDVRSGWGTWAALSCGAALGLSACGGAAVAPSEVKAPDQGPLADELVGPDGKPAPKWVTAPGTVHEIDGAKDLTCEQGALAGTRDMSMAQIGSQGRARTALTRSIEVRVKALLKNYQANTAASDAAAAASFDEQHVVDASKQIAALTLAGSAVEGTWISRAGTTHSLVCLDLAHFKDTVSKMSQLDERVRHAVEARADIAWNELDASAAPRSGNGSSGPAR